MTDAIVFTVCLVGFLVTVAILILCPFLVMPVGLIIFTPTIRKILNNIK
jgi:hypothetical protein